MDISIDLSDDLESRLNEEAAKAGVPPENYLISALSRFLNVEPNVSIATDDELLEFITSGLSQRDWNRYYALVAKRQDELLEANERVELTEMTDRIEHLNAVRMKCVVELAKRRKCSLDSLMQQLGIDTPQVL